MSFFAVEMKNITKMFPGFKALDEVNFTADYGEVLALMGENGAGKSTLMKILCGAYKSSEYSGDIYIDGKKVRINNIKDAEKVGISVIYQEFNLIPELSVAENVFLDRYHKKFPWKINWPHLYAETIKYLKILGIKNVSPELPVSELPSGLQQMVLICKALVKESRIIIFDEPTSALTERETQFLFDTILGLKKRGHCIIYITHKMDELFEISDKIMVLRNGKRIRNIDRSDSIDMSEVISRMVGDDIVEKYPHDNVAKGDISLEVKNYSVYKTPSKKIPLVKNINFSLREGEIIGIAGLMGSGRTKLVSSLFGMYPKRVSGEVYVMGRNVKMKSPIDAINNGIALLTEDRLSKGLLSGQNIINNINITDLDKVSSSTGVMHKDKERDISNEYVKSLKINPPDVDVNIDVLSGGNQQKVILGKWLNVAPKILILDEPTKGIDVGAKSKIYKIINDLLIEKISIILISSEMTELIKICDRILVMREGSIVSEIKKENADKRTIVELCTGVRK